MFYRIRKMSTFKNALLSGGVLFLCLFVLILRVHVSTTMEHTQIDKTSLGNQVTGEVSKSSKLMTRIEVQRKLVDEYCATHPTMGLRFQLPSDQERRELLYRHLLYDNLREIMFCFVEKIGCTDMKRFMFIAAGVLPEKTAGHEWVDLKYLEKGIKKASLQNKNLTDFKRIGKIRDYFKFTILRHPLERLVSGFRNKIEPPLVREGGKFNLIKQDILKKYRNRAYQVWLIADDSYQIAIQFSEFVNYFIQSDKNVINPHFKPFINTCHPCSIRYDFYGNFHNYGSDVQSVVDMFGLSFTWYRNKSLHSTSKDTRTLAKTYYDQLSRDQKLKLLHSFKEDLDFYYNLYPDERHIQDEFLSL